MLAAGHLNRRQSNAGFLRTVNLLRLRLKCPGKLLHRWRQNKTDPEQSGPVVKQFLGGMRFGQPLLGSIPVVVRLERPFLGDSEILGLIGGHLGQFDAQFFQVQTGNHFVEVLRQHVNRVF